MRCSENVDSMQGLSCALPTPALALRQPLTQADRRRKARPSSEVSYPLALARLGDASIGLALFPLPLPSRASVFHCEVDRIGWTA